MKIIIGAGKTNFDGWISTQEEDLNLLNRSHFESLSKNETITAMLAEHVWEHMSKEEGILAAKNCYDFLADGGYLRVAVPDKNFMNEWYQDMVKVGGNGNPTHPSFTHKILYDYKTLIEVFERSGFVVDLLEYCDENGDFHYKYWNENDGKIGRSFRFDTRNSMDHLGMVSIIIDAKKPLVIKQAKQAVDEVSPQDLHFSTITACGECCVDCKKKADGLCEGCIESDGHCKEWSQTGRCPIHACAKSHHVQFCGICPDFPCGELTTMIHWNPNVIEQLSDLAKRYRKQNETT